MSEITQYLNKKTVDDAMKLLEKSREQPIVNFTSDRKLPPSQVVKPLSSGELVDKLKTQSEEDSLMVPDIPEYFEGALPDPKFPDYRPLIFGRPPAQVSASQVPRLTMYTEQSQPSMLSEIFRKR